MTRLRPARLALCVAAGILTTVLVAASSTAMVAKTPLLKSKRLTIQLDPTDPERVTSLTWKDSGGTTIGNLIAEGGPGTCTDPAEFFGQSYGAPEGTSPAPVVGGHLATFSGTKTSGTITGSPTDCGGNPELPVTTKYTMFSGVKASETRISRTIGFDKHSGMFSGVGVRPYVPRLHNGAFTTVIYPNKAGTATTTISVFSCPGDCLIPTGPTWSGKWLADVNPADGYAMIVLRDPAMTSRVQMTVNFDSFSGSNLSSFVLSQPSKGWKKPVTEVEYLCFADLASWPQADRDAARLPAGCGP